LVPPQDPTAVVMVDPSVPEEKRYCSVCNEPVGRSRGDAAGRADGFCRTCGRPYSFSPKLVTGDLVAGQYEVAGCLAHGGLGWIYLAKDRKVSDRWVVLKGLLNTGDSDAVAAAVAERRFLAEVEHPNIVKIHNFVEDGHDGYIVMEYVAGHSLRRLLEERRLANEGRPDPLPAALAIAYLLEVLPALAHLHRSGLLFCDLKPDNVIQTEHSLKLIDLGGVYRVDDQTSPVYGTVGYQAPEIADTGPTIASDLYTVGRTLAVLTTEFRGYQTTYQFHLPEPADVPLYTSFDSLFRFLVRATAQSPDDRFQSAEEMADQLTGVLREIVAVRDGKPVPGSHKVFTAELRTAFDGPDPHTLPAALVRVDDPAAMFLASVTGTDPDELLSLLQAAPDPSVEIELRMARTLIDCGRLAEAAVHLDAVEVRDPWDWRVTWYRGIASLASGDTENAGACFTSVYHAVPGELAPKLALAYVAEHRGDSSTAGRWYDIVSRTDTAFPSAVFGLARCSVEAGDRRGAVAALDRVPAASSAYVEAQLAKVKVMVATTDGAAPETSPLLPP
jgi:serine/threonine-protein kinase PknG